MTTRIDETTNTLAATLDHVQFNNHLNNDIFRLIISFLDIKDLCRFEQVSKNNLPICKVCSEDSHFWKIYYETKILELNTMVSKSYNYKITETDRKQIGMLLKKTEDFKKTLNLAFKIVNDIIERNFRQRMEELEDSILNYNKKTAKNQFMTRDELLSVDISNCEIP